MSVIYLLKSWNSGHDFAWKPYVLARTINCNAAVCPGSIYCKFYLAILFRVTFAQVQAQHPPPVNPEGIPVSLAFLPLHHTYGLHTYSFRSSLAPTTYVILSQWNIDIALKAIPKYV